MEEHGAPDSLAAEVFAESYARACLGLTMPADLAQFWRERMGDGNG